MTLEIYTIFSILFFQVIFFIAIFAEALPFIGALVPGGAIALFLAGLFTKTGDGSFWLTWVVCFGASFSSDLYGYHLGKTWGERWIHKYSKYVLIKKEFLHRIADLLKQHPGKLLIFGKFNPVTRSIAPFMSGMKKIGPNKFRLLSIINSALWVSVFMGSGYLIGRGIDSIRFVARIVIITTIMLFILGYSFYLIREKIRKKRLVIKC
jgi:membrane-associated protein